MRFEILIQFIVPLMFLAIWALTSLLNRDAQPLPPRPGRPLGPGGPRPPGRVPGQPELRVPGSAAPSRTAGPAPARQDLQSAWTQPQAPAPAPRDRAVQRMTTSKADGAIVYIENDPARRNSARSTSAGSAAPPSSSGIRPARSATPRKGARGRSINIGTATPQGRTEPRTQRVLSDQVNQSMAMQRNKPLEITPLFTSLAPLSLPLSQSSAAPQAHETSGGDRPVSMSSEAIRNLLSSPARLREFALLTEVLQPPVALRRRQPRG